LARTAVEGGDEETILAAWNFAAEIGPNEQEPFIQLARLAETSEPENFEPLLRQAIEADPDAPAAYIVLGNYLVNQNNLVDAQMLFEQALALGPPDEISLLMTMAQNSELLGDTAAAIEYWQTVAIRNERRRGMAYYQIGRLAFEDGNFSSALAFFKRANEIEPENNQFLLGLAGAYAKLGCRQVALDLYQTVLDTAKAAPVRDEAQAQLAELAVLHDEVTPCSDAP
jgi:tetratricopeptide (TPR) repeat protein